MGVDERSAGAGAEQWMPAGFATAFRRALFAGIILSEWALVATCLVAPIGVPFGGVVLVSGMACIAGIAALFLPAPALLFSMIFCASAVFFHVVAQTPDGALMAAVIPLTSWRVVLPVMMDPRVRNVVVAALLSLMFAVVISIAHPDWSADVARVSAVTNAVLIVIAFVFVRLLRGVIASIDRSNRLALHERARAVRAHALSEATAEYLRVLHDTIMNTFAVLARDDAVSLPVADVRARARRDIERIHELGLRNGDAGTAPSLTQLDSIGLPIRWTGVSGDDLRRYQALLPNRVLRALHGCATEAILNATKHSGADHVDCDVSLVSQTLAIVITDSGRGFDVEGVEIRGIARSLVARAEAQGIEVQLESVPGRGTTVRLLCDLATVSHDHRSAPQSESSPRHRLELKMAIAWSGLVTAAGLIPQLLASEGGLNTASLMFAMHIVLTGIVWARCRHTRSAPGLLTAALLAAVPIANWCALAAVDYGRGSPHLFPAMSLTILPILLYVTSPTPRPFVAALVLQVLSTLVIAVVAADPTPRAWSSILLLEAPSMAQLAGYYVFLRVFRRIGVEAESRARAAHAATLDAIASEAALEFRARWSAPSLKEPLALLTRLAEGAISPADAGTRERCGDEERYLRGLSEIPQDSNLMGWWLALAVAESRTRSVELTLNASGVRIDDPDHAEALGRLMLECIRSAPRGLSLAVNVMPIDGATHMFLVADRAGTLAECARLHASEVLTVRCEEFPDQVLVEAVVDHARSRTP